MELLIYIKSSNSAYSDPFLETDVGFLDSKQFYIISLKKNIIMRQCLLFVLNYKTSAIYVTSFKFLSL